MARDSISEQLQQEVACTFLNDARREDKAEFLVELSRVGLKFLRDRIYPKGQKRFACAFDELVKRGCLSNILACSLYYYDKHELDYHNLPAAGEMETMGSGITDTIRAIRLLDNRGTMAVLAKCAQCGDPPRDREQALRVLEWYREALPSWWLPRKDIVGSYAVVPACMYAKIATRKFQFPLVAELLECLGYKPDPKRQKRAKEHSSGYTPCDESLERNFRNFTKRYPIVCERLKCELTNDHLIEEEAEMNVEPRIFNWDTEFRTSTNLLRS